MIIDVESQEIFVEVSGQDESEIILHVPSGVGA